MGRTQRTLRTNNLLCTYICFFTFCEPRLSLRRLGPPLWAAAAGASPMPTSPPTVFTPSTVALVICASQPGMAPGKASSPFEKPITVHGRFRFLHFVSSDFFEASTQNENKMKKEEYLHFLRGPSPW